MSSALFNEFWIQTLAGIIGVFVGIWLALVVERRRRAEDSTERDARQEAELSRVIDTILGSVVKNTAEAKGLLRLLAGTQCPRLLSVDLETAVWYASQGQFTTLCHNVDQRVIFSQFFDDVRRLQAFVDFRNQLQVTLATQHPVPADGSAQALAADVDHRLASLADALRFRGILLVTDHGKPVHRRLMGIAPSEADPTVSVGASA